VSLNNRISIRDTFGSREGIVNCSAATLPDSARSESTMAGMPMEIEKQQKPLMKHPLAEADTDVRVISESRDLILPFFSCAEQFPRRQT
jgi:hypothetical protein